MSAGGVKQDTSLRYSFPEEKEAFRALFPHTACAVERVERAAVCMLELGEIEGVVSRSFEWEGYPFVAEVAFPEKEARRFERAAEKRLLSHRLGREESYPVPCFPIELTFALGGGRERLAVMLGDFSEEGICAVCGAVAERQRALYRSRFSSARREER